jgi:hypothetical protein
VAGNSLAGFVPHIKAEGTKGTANVTSMFQPEGLRMVRMGRGGNAEAFKGGTGKTATGVLLSDDWGVWSMQPASCFNTLGLLAASRIATPVTTTPGGATLARQSVFTLNPNGVDSYESYTLNWGDGSTRFQSTYNVFQSLGFTAERGSIQATASMIGRTPASGASAPATPVAMPMRPIQPNLGDIWIDGAWADLGDTQHLACYRMALNLGDKFDLDAPINSSIVSFQGLPEKEDQAMTVELLVACDTAGLALVTDFEEGNLIAVRYLVEGAEIESGQNYTCQWDFLMFITSVGEITSAPGSNIATIPLSGVIGSDGTNSLVLTLINTITDYS